MKILTLHVLPPEKEPITTVDDELFSKQALQRFPTIQELTDFHKVSMRGVRHLLHFDSLLVKFALRHYQGRNLDGFVQGLERLPQKWRARAVQEEKLVADDPQLEVRTVTIGNNECIKLGTHAVIIESVIHPESELQATVFGVNGVFFIQAEPGSHVRLDSRVVQADDGPQELYDHATLAVGNTFVVAEVGDDWWLEERRKHHHADALNETLGLLEEHFAESERL